MTNATERLARPGLAAVFSAVIPGVGQWYGGRIRRAILVFAPGVGVLGEWHSVLGIR